MPDVKATILERDLNPYHSFISSFFAGFAELGVVNQGSINIVAKRAAEYLYTYLEAKEILPDMSAVPGDTIAEIVKNLILYINKILNLMGGYDLQEAGDDQVVLLIAGDKCRICPKGVGGAEVKGTLCPIPSFIESLINKIAGKEILDLVTNGIEKEGTTCIAYYQIKS
ncbi:MAG: hypothetical protein KAS84_04155 [Anaerolineales bacterium]|nr:hypothetical protein [Anaerolineales bacterium]